uniref:Uncharacterized protein n=1 Tax=Ananas comosus var. bracteatus TaxID=296719 RepID=A0A6V7Q3A5_ANACO|nr:unnamed protein product [Ananas comosus var. bracteatus]
MVFLTLPLGRCAPESTSLGCSGYLPRGRFYRVVTGISPVSRILGGEFVEGETYRLAKRLDKEISAWLVAEPTGNFVVVLTPLFPQSRDRASRQTTAGRLCPFGVCSTLSNRPKGSGSGVTIDRSTMSNSRLLLGKIRYSSSILGKTVPNSSSKLCRN